MKVLDALTRGPTLGEALARPHNGFTLVRLALALAVVVSHGFSVTTGSLAAEPLAASTGFTLGEHAVNGFFVISGCLVTMSFLRRGALDYAVARALRIVPGLLAAALVTALVIGPALTRLPLADYFADPGLRRFLVATLTSLKSATTLPRVFAENPFPFPLATVWTLRYEIFCYLGVIVLGATGLLARPRLGAALAGGLLAAVAGLDLLHPEASKGMQTALRLTALFCAGGALYLWRDRVRLSWPLLALLALATAAAAGTPLYRALLFATSAYGVIAACLAPVLSRPGLEPRADLSYGVYLYGWPLQQALVQLFPAAGALALLPPSLGLALLAAALSWHLVERPALSLKARLVRRSVPLASPQPAA